MGISITTVHGTTAQANVRSDHVQDLINMGFDLEIIPDTLRKALSYDGYPTYGELAAELETTTLGVFASFTVYLNGTPNGLLGDTNRSNAAVYFQ